MSRNDPATLGELLDQAVGEALVYWCKKHARGRPYEQAYAEDVRRVDVLCELNTSRRSTVFVSVIGRRPWRTETYDLQLPGLLRATRLPWQRD